MAGIFKSPAMKTKFERAYNTSSGLSGVDVSIKLVQNFDDMFEVLLESGLVERMQLAVHRVGVHPSNRGSKAMSGKAMQAKGAKIAMVGVSMKLCGPDKALCFESKGSDMFERMQHTVKHSELFGAVSENCNYGSVGCSHWNQFLHAVRDRAVSNEASIRVTKGTQIDTDRLYAADPVLKKLCETGLTWSVVNAKVADQYPQLPHLFQQALNTEHHIGEGEGWDQQLLSISKLATVNSKTSAAGTVINWENVTRLIRQSSPPFLRDIPSHVAYLKKYGGGAQQVLCRDVIDYLNHRMPAGRQVSGNIMEALSKVPIQSEFSIPHFVNGMVKAHATCAEEFCSDGFAKFISGSDIQSVSKKLKGAAVEAEGIMVKARQLLASVERDCVVDLGDFDVRLVLSVLGKSKEKVADIAAAFISEITGTIHTPPSSSTPANTTPKPADLGNVVEFSEGGAADVGRLTVLHQGFSVGCTAEKSGSTPGRAHFEGNLFKVTFIASDGNVTLIALDKNGSEKVSELHTKPMDVFLSEFKVYKLEIDVNAKPEYATSQNFKVEVAKSVLVCALDMVSHQSTSVQCQLQTKPKKTVIATVATLAGDAPILTPTTSNFKVLSESETAEFVATVKVQGDTHRFGLLAPSTGQTHVSTFFSLVHSDKAESVNCKIDTVPVAFPIKYSASGD